MVIYEFINNNHFSAETGVNYVSFGISARDSEHGQLCIVPDVFIGEQDARAFAERLNQMQVSPIHLMDVIEDTLGV